MRTILRVLRITTLAFVLLLLARPVAPTADADSVDVRLFLPLVATEGSAATLFGLEMTRVDASRGLANLASIPPYWLRRNGLLWRDVEPIKGGGYNWDAPAVQALEAEMLAARRLGVRLILVVRGSPTWATSPYEADCAPINPAEYASFARFLGAAAERYSAAPFSLRYWEIGNEPDVPVGAGDSPYGCWGQPDDPFYGGRAYGELLKVAYPALKAANPEAQLISGGLLLDRPYDGQTGSGLSARFIEGVLVAGAADFFDILSFHSYTFYDGTPDGTLGPVDWKPAYLRELLGRYEVDKPLLNTEGALLCAEATDACAQAQAHAMIRLYVRALRDQLLGFIWYIYDDDSFRNTALIEPSDPSVRRPAHRAYEQIQAQLAGAAYIGPINGLPAGMVGHQLASPARRVLVFWANEPGPVRLAVGRAAQLRCSEWDGAEIACTVGDDGVVAIDAVPGPRFVSFRAP